MRQLFLVLLSFTGTSLLAQTKEIAFKSHSGNMYNFKVTLENELFGEESDFGLPSTRQTYKLDSVIYISDSVSVVVKSEYEKKFTAPETEAGKFVRSVKDTVYNDPLFTQKHSLDSIRSVLKTLGDYVNPVNKVVFVGYDNKKPKEKKQKNNYVAPTFINDNGSGHSPFDAKRMLMLGTILGLSLLGGWISWRFYQPASVKRA